MTIVIPMAGYLFFKKIIKKIVKNLKSPRKCRKTSSKIQIMKQKTGPPVASNPKSDLFRLKKEKRTVLRFFASAKLSFPYFFFKKDNFGEFAHGSVVKFFILKGLPAGRS